ncbi:MAG: YraN family protein [bacterium]
MPSSDKPASGTSSGRSRGRHFERLAAEFYEAKGFSILARNYQVGRRELDLIVHKPGLLVFVEVKAAADQSFGHPAQKVDRRKIEHLTAAARQFLADHAIDDSDLRFDVVAFVGGRLEHFPNAFEAAP